MDGRGEWGRDNGEKKVMCSLGHPAPFSVRHMQPTIHPFLPYPTPLLFVYVEVRYLCMRAARRLGGRTVP